jgi:hypothetical protein
MGLLLFTYVAIQAFNPWMLYVRNDIGWWIVPTPNTAWLPAGIESPFSDSNAFRMLIVYSSAWLVSCSAWVGLNRGRSWRILLSILVANAIALSMLLAYQRATGDTELPWPLKEFTQRDELVSSFVYSNHAGAYFSLMTLAAVALAVWGNDDGARTMKKSTPAAVLGLVAFFLAMAVLFTHSRGASLVMGGALTASSIWFYLRCRFRPLNTGTDYRVTLVILALFGVFILYVGRSLDFSSINDRFDALVEGKARESVAWRVEAQKAGLSLLEDHGLRGVGAGGFRFIFPGYVRRYPDIFLGSTLFWEHVHNDWLETAIELGAGGAALLAVAAAFWVRLLIRSRKVWYASIVPILFGCLGTLAHAWADFPFQCPAILTTWLLLLTMVSRRLKSELARKV